MAQTFFRACSLCEAGCGLRLEVDGERVVSVRGDTDDVFSRGYICPKGTAVGELHHDPDRLRGPVRRTAAGTFEPISWEEAFALVARRLRETQQKYGRDSIAVYVGNPVVHNVGALLLRAGLLKALGTRNSTSAGSQDTSPRFAASYYLYGASLSVPVPDIDRTDYLLCLGANPRVSNGSFMTAPDVRSRLQGIRDRGGKVVVVDPRRTETAREATEHVAILPGGDAYLLLAMVNCLLAAGRVDEDRLRQQTRGWDAVLPRLAALTAESAAEHCGVPAATIRRLALEFADARTAVAYTRIGVCNSARGTLASYAGDLLNLAAGRLGAVGGAMFGTPAFDLTPIVKLTRADGHARWRTRVRKLPETLGDVPAATLAEEMETPGPGQVRAFLTFAGNPVLSTPNGRRLEAALGRLDFMVSIDLYINETTRHADVILPPASGLADEQVEILGSQFGVRNVARWSPPVVSRGPGELSDWQILLELTYRLGGGPTGIGPLDWLYRQGRKLGLHWKPDSSIDLILRLGPYGDRFRPWSSGLNLKKLKKAEHGIDFGPLNPGLKQGVKHKDGKVCLDAAPLLHALDRLGASLAAEKSPDELLLIGRRELRSNNSWMHNVPSLVSGKPRCVLLVNPQDAARLGIRDGQNALLESRIRTAEVPVRLSDDMRPGTVSLPHGWGHTGVDSWQKTAAARPGVSANDWTDDQKVEEVVGQSILNGVPVRLRPAAGPTPHQAAALVSSDASPAGELLRL
jgi:anaerobic selenocysteine-containing dehydrogenase